MAAGNIEASRKGTWWEQAISKINPGKGVNLVVAGPVESSLVDTSAVNDSSSFNPSTPVGTGEDANLLWVVGLGLRKDSGYREALMTCREIWIPFIDEVGGIQKCVLEANVRTSYPDWIYVWSTASKAVGSKNAISRSWMPGIYEGTEIYNEYIGSGQNPDLDYEYGVEGPGNIIFVPYIHPNYLTTDDYNGILGNVMKTTEPDHLYSVLMLDAETPYWRRKYDLSGSLSDFISPNLRYKHYLVDSHRLNAVGGLHAGELNVPQNYVSRCEEQGEYFRSFMERANKDRETGSLNISVQALDLPFMSYRAISASVYVDQLTNYVPGPTEGTSVPDLVPIEKIWEDMQGGNVDDPETIYFINRAIKTAISGSSYDIIKFENRTSVPVLGNILFRMDGHIAVRIVNATLYAPFLNTVFRTGEYGEILDSFTSGSE